MSRESRMSMLFCLFHSKFNTLTVLLATQHYTDNILYVHLIYSSALTVSIYYSDSNNGIRIYLCWEFFFLWFHSTWDIWNLFVPDLEDASNMVKQKVCTRNLTNYQDILSKTNDEMFIFWMRLFMNCIKIGCRIMTLINVFTKLHNCIVSKCYMGQL